MAHNCGKASTGQSRISKFNQGFFRSNIYFFTISPFYDILNINQKSVKVEKQYDRG